MNFYNNDRILGSVRFSSPVSGEIPLLINLEEFFGNSTLNGLKLTLHNNIDDHHSNQENYSLKATIKSISIFKNSNFSIFCTQEDNMLKNTQFIDSSPVEYTVDNVSTPFVIFLSTYNLEWKFNQTHSLPVWSYGNIFFVNQTNGKIAFVSNRYSTIGMIITLISSLILIGIVALLKLIKCKRI